MRYILFILLTTLVFKGHAQKRPIFLGLQPGVTKEQYYDENEFDINIIPLVLESPIGERVSARLTTILNYRFGDNAGISDIGFQFLAPIYFKKQEKTVPKSGFYIAPLIGLGTNQIEDKNSFTLAAEPGYFFETNRKFTLSLGLQIGGTHFNYESGSDEWVSHFGVKVNLGWWL